MTYQIHPNSLANLKPENRKGLKQYRTITKGIYEGVLYKVAKHRLPKVFAQIARDATDPELDKRYQQKAQQMIIDSMEALAKLDDKTDQDNKLDIQISREGVLIQQGKQTLSIEGGVVKGKGGGEVSVVPYNPFSTEEKTITPQVPGVTDRARHIIDGVLVAPNTDIPYSEFVGPLPKGYQNHHILPAQYDEEFQEGRKEPDVEEAMREIEMRFEVEELYDSTSE